MTATDIQCTTDADITVLPAQRPSVPDAIESLRQHAAAMGTAKQLAEAMCGSELVPQIYRGKPDNGAAAILYGAEIGLNPIQSLQQIFVVHGSPAIYARTMVAIVKSRGYIIQTIESTDESVTVRGEDPRTGEVEQDTWTIERAKKAGYTTNKKYETDPRAMLYAKAAAGVCRRLAPQVLLGIAQSVEEMELEDRRPARRVDVTVGPSAVENLRAELAAPAAEKKNEQPATERSTTSRTSKPKPITEAQMKKMHALLNEKGLGDRATGLAWISACIEREITTSKDLTVDDAKKVIDTLENDGEIPADGQEG